MSIKVLYDRGITIENLDLENNKFIEVYDTSNESVILPRVPFKELIEINKSYFTNCMFAIDDGENEPKLFKSNEVKDVMIEIHSTALGDQLAWIPICDLFQKKYNCKLQVNCRFPELFQPHYDNISFGRQYFHSEKTKGEKYKFIDRYILGYSVSGFYNSDELQVSPIDCRAIGLQQMACYQLGIKPQEVRPNYKSNIEEPIIKGEYVVITTSARGDCKEWQYKNGWKEIVRHYKKRNIKVVHVGDNNKTLKDTINKKGRLEWNKLINIMQHSKAFIGLPSGLSWFAWSCGANVTTIDGITSEFAYFDCNKVQNIDVCHGCWNDLSLVYTNSMDYCPRNKDYECTKMITPEMIIEKL